MPHSKKKQLLVKPNPSQKERIACFPRKHLDNLLNSELWVTDITHTPKTHPNDLTFLDAKPLKLGNTNRPVTFRDLLENSPGVNIRMDKLQELASRSKAQDCKAASATDFFSVENERPNESTQVGRPFRRPFPDAYILRKPV